MKLKTAKWFFPSMERPQAMQCAMVFTKLQQMLKPQQVPAAKAVRMPTMAIPRKEKPVKLGQFDFELDAHAMGQTKLVQDHVDKSQSAARKKSKVT